MSRFNYVKYDEKAVKDQAAAKDHCELLECEIDSLPTGRAKSMALTKLEECYMWIGKAIRDHQIERNGSAEPQEERNNE